MKAKELYAKAEHLKQRYSIVLDYDKPMAEQIWESAKLIEAAARSLEFLEGLEMDDELKGIDDVGFGRNGRPM